MSPKSQDIKQSGLFGFLAQPDAPTKAGVVLLPTIFGVNAFARGYAETLARAGLAAAVWDHYEGLPLTTDYDESRARARKLSDAGMHAKVGKWIDYMLGELRLTSVGVAGFPAGLAGADGAVDWKSRATSPAVMADAACACASVASSPHTMRGVLALSNAGLTATTVAYFCSGS